MISVPKLLSARCDHEQLRTISALIVEDDPGAASAVAACLRSLNYGVVGTAASSEEAVELARWSRPHVVLLKVPLSGSTGGSYALDVIRREINVPVVLISDPDGMALSERIKACDHDGWIITPVVSQVLRNSIELALRSFSAQKALQREVEVNATLARLAELLIACDDLEEISAAVLRKACLLTSSRYGLVGYLDELSGRLIIPAVSNGAVPGCSEGTACVVFSEFKGLLGLPLRERRTVLVNDLAADPKFAGLPPDHPPLENFLSSPAVAGALLMGQLAVANSERPYTNEDRLALERLAALYALAVQRGRAKQSLFKSERRCSLLMEQAADGIFIVDRQGGFVELNARMCELTGYTRQELLGMTIQSLWVDAMSRQAVEAFIARLEQGETLVYERRLRRKDGSSVEVEVGVKQLEGGLYQAILRDITNRKAAERELRSVVRSLDEDPNPVLRVRDGGSILYANPAGARVLDAWGSESRGQVPSELRREVGTALASGRTSQVETEVAGRSFSWTVAPIVCEACCNIYGLDVTEGKQAERERRLLATAMEQTAEAVFILAPDFTLRYVNPAFENLTGYRRDEVLMRHICMLDGGASEKDIRLLKEAVHKGRAWSGRMPMSRKDGRPLIVETMITPLRDEAGRLVETVNIWRDVTREELLEKQLRHAHKMEALGSLAGGIAHDFNNILASIAGFAEMAQIKAQDSAFVRHNLGQILAACVRARDMVRHILTFCRRSEQNRQPISLRKVVVEAAKMLRASLPSTIAIRQEFGRGSDKVLADPVQVHQVVMNLGTNAGYAMRLSGGELALCVSSVSLGAAEAEDHGLAPGAYVRLAVQDTGEGVSAEIMERIFDPFFTTKPTGEGTGLGLSVTHGIVESHGGAVTVSSKPGQGACFVVFLPAHKGDAETREASGEMPGGSENILLVDDDPGVLQAMSQMLEALGYAVTACGGKDALRRILGTPWAYDCLITDQAMPGITGQDLATRAKQVRPDLPVVLCTGYADPPDGKDGQDTALDGFLMKPVFIHDLAWKVREILDKAEDSRG